MFPPVPLYNDEKFSWDLSSLSLRKSALESINYDEVIQKAVDVLKEQKRFKYDALFLVFSGEDMKVSGRDVYNRKVDVRYGKNGLVIEK